LSKVPHFAPEVIDKAARDMRAAVEGQAVTVIAKRYARLAGPVTEAYVRWSLDEINRGTAPDAAASNVGDMIGWLMAQCVVHAPPQNRLKLINIIARGGIDSALGFLKTEGASIVAPTSDGGHS
jgi:hypothetical protein